jgi:hypothetical protein
MDNTDMMKVNNTDMTKEELMMLKKKAYKKNGVKIIKKKLKSKVKIITRLTKRKLKSKVTIITRLTKRN